MIRIYPNTILWNFKWIILILITFCLLRETSAQAQTTPFLTAPYWGTTTISAVFDHEYPTYATLPEGVVNRNGTLYTTGACAEYNGHPAIDYGLRYDYVLAAHEGQVSQAGWSNPENRRTGLGLRIEIDVATAERNPPYKTRYAHLSTLFVEVNQLVAQQDLIAISGNTGNSTGPHLHFEVLKYHTNSHYPVNPYGWAGPQADPWQSLGRPASVNLWEDEPAITELCSYESGDPLELDPERPLLTPDLNAAFLVIDETDDRFEDTGDSWQIIGCAPPTCYGSSYRYITRTDENWGGAGIWSVRQADLVTGEYDVYTYIPNNHADTRVAYYEIVHNNTIHSAGIDQSRFNKDTNQPAWAYLGRYKFDDGGLTPNGQRVVVYHEGCYQAPEDPEIEDECNPEDEPIVEQDMAADAMVFVLVDGPPNLVIPMSNRIDDAGRQPNCGYNTSSTAYEIYFGYCNGGAGIISGFRYRNINIPAGANITRTHLKFFVDGPFDYPLNLRIYGDNNPASPAFSIWNKPEDRLLTKSWHGWIVPESLEWGFFETQYSPNLNLIVDELVNHPSWQPGVSSLTFIIKPNPPNNPSLLSPVDHRRVMAYERIPGNGSFAAELLIWYETD